MKKLLGILMAALVVIPLVGVKAIEGNYYTYNVGDEVNFYMYEGDQTGSRTIILHDDGANSQYVKVLMTGLVYATSEPWMDELDEHAGTKPNEFHKLDGYNKLMDQINTKLNGAPYARNVSEELSLLTFEDLVDVFGITASGDKKYTLDWNKWGKVFSQVPTSSQGIYTQSTTEDGKELWVIKFQKDESQNVTGATVETIPAVTKTEADQQPSTTTNYAYIPVVYADKTYDCVERDAGDKFSCYDCNGEYVWTAIGEQDPSCTEVEDAKTQSTCVKNVQTGVNQYFVQFGIIAGLCALALVAVNRKNLFKKI